MQFETITISDTEYIADGLGGVMFADENGSHLIEVEVLELDDIISLDLIG
jgi:hypothetical protein